MSEAEVSSWGEISQMQRKKALTLTFLPSSGLVNVFLISHFSLLGRFAKVSAQHEAARCGRMNNSAPELPRSSPWDL